MTKPDDMIVETGGGLPSNATLAVLEEGSCPFDVLCDDAVSLVALHCDFATAVRFLRCVSRNIRRRVLGCDWDDFHEADLTPLASKGRDSAACGAAAFNRLWMELYRRHQFAPPEGKYGGGEDYLSECRRRRDLFRNLVGSRTSHSRKRNYGTGFGWGASTSSSPFGSLPNRYFHFLPLTPSIDSPDDGEDEWDLGLDDDPPPVEFVCDSYALLSPGTGCRMILMDPFDGSISVKGNVLDDAVASEEGMLERAMAGAATAVMQRRNGHENGSRSTALPSVLSSSDDEDDDSAQVGGAAIEDAIRRNHDVGPGTPPEQVLFGVEDYFSIDINEYFQPRAVEGGVAMINAGGDGSVRGERIPQDPVGLAMEVTRHGFVDGIDHEGETEDEITVDWLGVSVHNAVDPADGTITGALVGAARILTNEDGGDDDDHARRPEDERTCSEVIGWRRSREREGEQFDVRYSTRISGFPNYMDIDASNDKVYATFAPGEGPFPFPEDANGARVVAAARSSVDNDNEDAHDDAHDNIGDEQPIDDVDWNGNRIRRSRCVARYPFIRTGAGEKENTPPKSAEELFPAPEAALWASRPVSCIAVDPTGRRVLLGTDGGIVEVWDSGLVAAHGAAGVAVKPKKLQACDIGAALAAVRRTMMMSDDCAVVARSVNEENRSDCDVAISMNVDEDGSAGNEEEVFHALAEEDVEVEESNITSEEERPSVSISQCDPVRRIEGVALTRHLPVESSGFVSLQHHRNEGTVLGLWQKHTLDENKCDEPFQLAAVINLPLSPQRKPQVSYDGRRLLVFGQDHIGLIVLVYHVLSTQEDQDWFETNGAEASPTAGTASKNCRLRGRHPGGRVRSGSFGDASGGVINLLNGGSSVRVRYANRVRHAGLGGLEYYDPAFMTANERFVVVNTKAGNLVGGDGGTVQGACEGLFVIDLEERNL